MKRVVTYDYIKYNKIKSILYHPPIPFQWLNILFCIDTCSRPYFDFVSIDVRKGIKAHS